MSLQAISLGLMFCASRKGGTGGGGRVSTLGRDSMVTFMLSCRKPLVGTEWAILSSYVRMGLLAMFPFCAGKFFSQSVQVTIAVTIKSSLKCR